MKEGVVVKKDKGVLELDRDVLFKVEKDGRRRLVMPTSEREKIMRSVHEDPRTGGHFTVRKGILKVRTRYWWPGIYKDLEQWVATCRVCQAHQHVRGMPKMKSNVPRVVPNRPWDSVYIDAIGPLPASRNGMRYVLVAIDHFTRYVEVKAVRRLTKEAFVKWRRDDQVGRWGPMTWLTSDRGSNFMADVSKAMCEILGIDKHSATAWRARAMGLVERFNGTLKALFKEYAEETGSNWHEGIQDWAFAYNTTVHSATGFTPFHLMHGWEARVPYDLLVEQREEPQFREVREYRDNMVNAIEECWAEARRNQGERDRVREWHLTSVAREENGIPRYEVGERVWKYKPFISYSKGGSKGIRQLWFGPYTIVERISPRAYVIDRNGTEDVVNVEMLKRYKVQDMSAPRSRYERARAEVEKESEVADEDVTEVDVEASEGKKVWEGGEQVEGDGDVDEEEARDSEVESVVSDEDRRGREDESNAYEVEQILDKRVLRRSGRLGPSKSVEYFIKWKNWSDKEASCEAMEPLVGCMDLVEEFEERLEAWGDRHPTKWRTTD